MEGYKYHQRADCPSSAHGSVDRQRNDRLGRKDEHYLAKHRRKILRRCTESDTHANTFSDPNRDSYGKCNCNSNTYGYSHGHS